MRRQAFGDYARLAIELPEALRPALRGSLVWERTADATEALVASHRGAGATVELLERADIERKEPRLRNAPAIAASSPADIAVSPAHLASTFVGAAIAAGAATNWGHAVSIETSGAKVAGIRAMGQRIPADVVIVAAGPSTNQLTTGLGIDLALRISPVLLLRYAAQDRFVGQIVRGPELEIRQEEDNSLLVVADHAPDDEPEAVGRRMLTVVKANFDVPGVIALRSARIGARPLFADGLPRVGFLPGIRGLYVAVGHPGSAVRAPRR